MFVPVSDDAATSPPDEVIAVASPLERAPVRDRPTLVALRAKQHQTQQHQRRRRPEASPSPSGSPNTSGSTVLPLRGSVRVASRAASPLLGSGSDFRSVLCDAEVPAGFIERARRTPNASISARPPAALSPHTPAPDDSSASDAESVVMDSPAAGDAFFVALGDLAGGNSSTQDSNQQRRLAPFSAVAEGSSRDDSLGYCPRSVSTSKIPAGAASLSEASLASIAHPAASNGERLNKPSTHE